MIPDDLDPVPRGMELLQEKLEACVMFEYTQICQILQDNCIQYVEGHEIPFPCIQSIPADRLPKSPEALDALGLGLCFFETPTSGIIQRLSKLTSLG